MDRIKNSIRTIPDFPKKGIMFRDITTMLQDPLAFKEACDSLARRYTGKNIEVVVGIESRGFIFAAVLSYLIGASLVPARKPGKLPSKTIKEDYRLEYGSNTVEIHEDSIKPGQRVLVVDDLIATGGTALATCNLVARLHGNVVECAFIVDLPDLGGAKRLKDAGFSVFKLVDFEGD